MFHKNKKAQIGETMTWVIATIVIIVILVFSIFISSFIGRGRDKMFPATGDFRNLIEAKSISGFLLTENDYGERIFDQILEEGDLNDFNGPIGVAIFENYEIENYDRVKHYSIDENDKYIRGVFLTLKSMKSNRWPLTFGFSVRKEYFAELPQAPPITNERFYLEDDKYLAFYFG